MHRSSSWIAASCIVAALPFSLARAQGQQPAVAPAAHSMADFALLPSVQGPRLSPDGTRFAAKVAVGGKQYFAIVPIDSGQKRLVGLGDTDLNWWRWVGNEHVVLGIGQVQPIQSEDFYIRRALAVNVATGKISSIAPREAAQNADDVIWAADDGAPRVMLSYQTSLFLSDPGFWPTVREVDLATGRSRVVQQPMTDVMSWYADHAGIVRMGIAHGDEGRSTRVLYRAGAEERLKVVGRARNRGESVMVPAIFPAQGGSALAIDDDEDGFSALYDLDLATMTRGRQILASKGYDIGGLVTDPSGGKLLGVETYEERSTTRWIDPDLKAMAAEAAGMVKGAGAEIVSLSRDHQRAIVLVSGAGAPGAYMLFDRADRSMTMIDHINAAFRMRRLHPVSTIRYKARDGLEIAAVLTMPRGEARRRALIVLPHGGPFARDGEEWDWWSQFLADRGYVVVQPNYRGSSGYGTRFTRRGEGQWGLAMQDDLNDAVDALAKRGVADPARVCIVGASYGGYAAMHAAERDPGVFRCAISYAGVSDLRAMMRYDSRFLNAGVRSDWMRQQAPDFAAVSPINAVARFSTPILLLHGVKDRVVPVRQSRSLAQKLKQAGKDVTYIEQPEGDHHFSRMEDRLQFLEAMTAFLKAHNPA